MKSDGFRERHTPVPFNEWHLQPRPPRGARNYRTGGTANGSMNGVIIRFSGLRGHNRSALAQRFWPSTNATQQYFPLQPDPLHGHASVGVVPLQRA
jgi:hypothetical protein